MTPAGDTRGGSRRDVAVERAPVEPARRGRRTGGGDARADILAAARAEFAVKGYDGASLRAIARTAGVDPALVHHYFDGKEELFVAALALPFRPAVAMPEVLAGDVEALGERLVRFMLSVWGDEQARAPFLALLGSAFNNEQAAAMLRGFLSTALLGRVAALLPGPDARLRVTVAASALVGMVTVRYVVRVEPLAGATDDEVVALLAPVVQSLLSG